MPCSYLEHPKSDYQHPKNAPEGIEDDNIYHQKVVTRHSRAISQHIHDLLDPDTNAWWSQRPDQPTEAAVGQWKACQPGVDQVLHSDLWSRQALPAQLSTLALRSFEDKRNDL